MNDSVYVLSNAAFAPDLRKIGFTKGALERRISQLSTTGVPTPFVVDYWCEVTVGMGHVVEHHVHRQLSDYRYNSDREFFRITTIDAARVIRTCAGHAFVSEGNSIVAANQLRREQHAKNLQRSGEIFTILQRLEQKEVELVTRSTSMNPFRMRQSELAAEQLRLVRGQISELKAKIVRVLRLS